MCDVAIVVQARLTSYRLPKKILADLGGRPMLAQIVRRCDAVSLAGVSFKTVIAAPYADVAEILDHVSTTTIAGPEVDVLSRILNVADATGCEKIVRVTGDCPFVCPRMIENMVNHAYFTREEVVANWRIRTFPNGLDLEVYDADWLRKRAETTADSDREYFAQGIIQEMPFKSQAVIVNSRDLSRYRLTVDYAEDLELARALYAAMGGEIWDSKMIIDYLDTHPELLRINAKYARETGSREENEKRKDGIKT